MRHTIRSLAASLFLFAAACGGGGVNGGGENPEPLKPELDGQYAVMSILASNDPINIVQSATGTIEATAKTLALDVISNVDGDAINPSNSVASYRAEEDGSIFITNLGVDIQQGGIAAGGDAAVMGMISTGPVGNLILVRRAPGFDPGLLDGGYHHVAFARNAPIDDHIGSFRRVVFQPTGNLVIESGIQNTDGTVGTSAAGTLTYTVGGAGELVIQQPGPQELRGGVSPDGNFAIAAGQVLSGGLPLLNAMVRESTAASVALLEGEYWMVSFHAEANGYVTRTGTIDFNGQGQGLALMRRKVNDLIGIAESSTVTYAVQANGRLDLGYQNILGTVAGGVSPDGRYAVLGGGLTGRPSMQILIRK